MSGNDTSISFDRLLHQALPHPLAHAYRKAFNSPTPKELHDNACLFGLCLLRYVSVLGLALVRELRITLNREEAELLEKMDRPAEGDWHRWLVRAVARIREARLSADSLGAALDAYLYEKRDRARSPLPAAIEKLIEHLEKKVVVRKDATAHDFLLLLIRYRNDTIGHGAVLPDEKNQEHGEAVLRAAAELARTLPLADAWELKYVAKSSLGPTSVDCQWVQLTGPDWLREPPTSYPRGYPAPLPGHVVLLAREGNQPHLDLHPLVVFHNERVLFFNGLRGKSPGYLEYDTAQKLVVESLADDYANWKTHLGSHSTSDATGEPGSPSVAAPAATSSSEPEQRFRFDRRLGRGGMGEVWSAYDNVLKRQVAIKRIRPELLGRDDVDRRFLQEARDAARLNHPNIVQILSVGSDDQGPYLVLEFLEGASLREMLQRAPLELPMALAYLRQLLQALEHAHEQGLIHHDVKPENIMLTRAGVPKLADFGLAWFWEENQESTPPREGKAIEGTRFYAAPELRGGDRPSPRSDLYALGITFYEMLTGRSPERVEEKRIASPALPLLRKLLQPDPNLRYATAQAALDDCLELERSLELAGRTEAETAARIRKTAEESLELLAEGRAVDAQAGFERILAEDPENVQARSGMLLLYLSTGDMEQAATRYRALMAQGADDPVFLRLRAFFDEIASPILLRLSLQPLPYSYHRAELAQGRFVKELIELSANTVNLGDAGELLVELSQRLPGSRLESVGQDRQSHRLLVELGAVRIEADFHFSLKPKTLFAGPRLLAADLALLISGDSFDIYRFVRYLTTSLTGRFKRPAADWVRPTSEEAFGYDAQGARKTWERLTARIVPLVLNPAAGSTNV